MQIAFRDSSTFFMTYRLLQMQDVSYPSRHRSRADRVTNAMQKPTLPKVI